MHEVFLSQNIDNIYVNQGPFISVGSTTGIGTFGGEKDSTNVYLKFYPDSGITTSIKLQAYNEVMYTLNDFDNDPTDLEYGTTSQSVLLSSYDAITGTKANKVNFDLKQEGTQIYVKTFNPTDTQQLDPATGIFTIPNHFFNTSEELIYTPTSTFIGVGETSVGIGSTANYLGIVTDKLPGRVYPIVINENQFRLSTRQDYANAGIYVTFTDSGLGNAHKLEMTKKLEKTVISLDGLVQQPVTYTPITHSLTLNNGQISSGIQTFGLTGISTILPRDLLKVNDEYLALEDGPPIFRQDYTCPALLVASSVPHRSFHIRGYHPLWPAFPSCFVMSCAITCRLLRFRSPLLSESRLISFPRATEMFQFTRFASLPYVFR